MTTPFGLGSVKLFIIIHPLTTKTKPVGYDFKGFIQYLTSDPKKVAIRKEQGICYSKYYVVYIDGMKCLGSVYSRGWSRNVASMSSKNYGISCNYYNTFGEERLLGIYYRYQFLDSYKELMNDKRYRGEQLLADTVEADFKLRIKRFIRSIKIKNLDHTKTKTYDKEFESTKW